MFSDEMPLARFHIRGVEIETNKAELIWMEFQTGVSMSILTDFYHCRDVSRGHILRCYIITAGSRHPLPNRKIKKIEDKASAPI